MAIRIKFDNTHNVIQPTFILATKSGKKLGVVPAYNITIKDNFNASFELSFQVNKMDNGKRNFIWDKLKDFRMIWCREWDTWFEIYVEISEDNDSEKNVTAVSLGEAELSHAKLFNIEINTETDISRDDYSPTILFDENSPDASLLNRITEKVPHYSINHVDLSIKNIQRTFTFDNISIYDAFKQIAEEINCIFIIDSGTNADGSIKREISVYDLESYCLDCGTRENFTKTCPNCSGTNVLNGYGEDTSIYVSTENLADNITFTTDKDSVKNCFRLEAGDDLMTATIINCNPNGSAYLWYNSESDKEDMSEELASTIASYEEDYDYYQQEHQISFAGDELTKYNALIEKYKTYSDTLKTVPETITGYPALMNIYYDTVDFYLFLNNELMPSVELMDTTAELQAASLIDSLPLDVAVQNLDTCSSSTASSAVLAMVKTIIDTRYQVKVNEGILDGTVWEGSFIITNYSNEEDTTTTDKMQIGLTDDFETYVKQKIDKTLNKKITEEATDIISLFNLEYDDFVYEITKYGLASLQTFCDSCQTCLDILIEQGVANDENWVDKENDLYSSLYLSYYNKLIALQNELKLRESEIAMIIGSYDIEGNLLTSGLQTIVDGEKNKIQIALNFQAYLGENLWLEFVSYRREDTYRNENYISDGLDNRELINRALEFIETARKEIYKSANLQHSISATLKNLLVMKEFESIVDYFSVGNWIRVRVDDTVYRLRLLSYTIDFNNLNNISIEFSDVKKTAYGMDDKKSVIEQTQAVIGGFSSVAHQASQGNKGNQQLQDWVAKGLSLTNMKIINDDDDQVITIDKHGILGRRYLPITDSYDNKQFKIINRGLYLTDDNWLTSKAGIGDFVFYNPETGKMEEAYGVIADVLVGHLVLSEKVGIYNMNNSIVLGENGLIITTNEDVSDEGDTTQMAFTIQKKTTDADGNESIKKFMYINDDGELVLNGSVHVTSSSTSGSSSSILDDIFDETKFNDKVTQIVQDEISTIEGIDGVYFHIAYSQYEDGHDMATIPDENTLYLGTCSNNSETAPTEYTEYTWVKVKGDTGSPGEKGEDGKTQYLHIKYSDDGESFTENDGETLGAWIGTLVDFVETDSTTFSDYTWKKFTEDVDDELNQLHEQIVTQETSIQNACNEIILNALSSYVKVDDLTTITQEQSELKQQADSMLISFNQTVTELANKNAALEQQVNTMTTYFTFNINGLTIGKKDNPYKVIINNERYSMTVNDVEVMWIADGKVYTPEIEVTRTFRLFDYLIDMDAYGNVNCEYIGEDKDSEDTGEDSGDTETGGSTEEAVAFEIVTQPEDMEVEAEGLATLSVVATGENLTYQWKYSETGTGWYDLELATTATYSFTADKEMDGYYFRCRIEDSNGDVLYTDTVELIIS